MGREIKAAGDVELVSKSFDGEHTIAFKERSHRYKMDGKPAVGVTTFTKSGYITSMGLITWMREETAEWLFEQLTVPGEAGFLPREAFWPIIQSVKDDLVKAAKKIDRGTAQEAADIGTICHGYAELHSLGKIEEAEALLDKVRNVAVWPLIESCVNKYKEWAATNRGKLVYAEELVGSPTHRFCGKFDRLDLVNGKLRLRDYKTSKDIYAEQFIQLAAYTLAIKEWLNLDVQEMEVLRFGKDDGSFETLVIDNPDEIRMFQEQAIRCRQTYDFRKIEEDARFDWKKKKKK